MFISVLVILTGCAKNENVVKEEATNLVENKVENKAEDTQVSKNIENKVKTEKSENEIVEELFIEYLKNTQDKLSEYKIEKIEILSGEDREFAKSAYENKINEKDIFAEVTYSVKPEDIKNTAWIAGNGEMEGNWINNKLSCVYVQYNNGTYEIEGQGTGW